MRFLANENFPLPSTRRLRAVGHDVWAVVEDAPGSTDAAILARAASEWRIIMTFDRDYGELIFRLRLPTPAGVVYFRFDPATPDEPAEHLLGLMAIDQIRLDGMFTVVERHRVRQRPLP
ncbi:MAG: DUF5615 family PIN-like protein [Armatimonadetes bacterium]|nr:DUF5615 family PIN-like protein [Armatimonadota bacterium]